MILNGVDPSIYTRLEAERSYMKTRFFLQTDKSEIRAPTFRAERV